MNEQNLHETMHHFWKHTRLTAFALTAAVCVSGAAADQANALYILTGAQDSAIVLDESATAKDFSSQMVYLTTNSSGYDVTLAPDRPIEITFNGETRSAVSERETVSSLLKRMHIIPGPMDMVLVDLSDHQVSLTIDDQLTYYDRETKHAPYQSIRVANPKLLKGVERVKQVGKDGETAAIYEVVWSGGKMVSRQFVEETASTAVDEIIEYGTASAKPSSGNLALPVANVSKNSSGGGVLTLADGSTLEFTGSKRMTATAYTAGYGGANHTTATGTRVRKGTVAVDRRVIPLGTKMYIVTNDGIVYGEAVAEDTGVRGNVIDLYHSTYNQCINFGRRGCTVYFLK